MNKLKIFPTFHGYLFKCIQICSNCCSYKYVLRMHAIFKLRPIKTAKYVVNIFFILYLFIENSSLSVLLIIIGPVGKL